MITNTETDTYTIKREDNLAIMTGPNGEEQVPENWQVSKFLQYFEYVKTLEIRKHTNNSEVFWMLWTIDDNGYIEMENEVSSCVFFGGVVSLHGSVDQAIAAQGGAMFHFPSGYGYSNENDIIWCASHRIWWFQYQR